MTPLRIILTIIVAFQCHILIAQVNGKISGKIVDIVSGAPLDGATISAMNDSSGMYIVHAISDKKGEFTLTRLPLNVRMEIISSYSGYKDTSSKFVCTSKNPLVESGSWKMKRGVENLVEVVVTGRKPPFVMRNDTLEFNASSFKSLPNDMVKDLLRKLPGMFIDEFGNVTVNGKKVTKIQVDGRDFFTGNIKVATDNLPSNIIDKVQVTETKEKGDEIKSIVKPLNKDLTLNLTLKKENKKGMFGTVTGGYGTKDRYDANFMLNSFNEVKRLSIFGGVGNLKDMQNGMPNSGAELIPIMIGQTGSAMQTSSGIVKRSSTAGFNMNNDLGKKAKVDIFYQGGETLKSQENMLQRTNILPDSSFLYDSKSIANSRNSSHSLNGRISIDIDSLQSMIFAPIIKYSKSIDEALNNSASSTMNGQPINAQINNNKLNDESLDASNNLTYNRRSRDNKTSLNANWNIGLHRGNGDQINRSQNTFYNSPQGTRTDTLDQKSDIHNNSITNNLSIFVNRKLSQHFVGIISYRLDLYSDKYIKSVYNINNISNKHDLFDSVYSNDNRTSSIAHSPMASIGYDGGIIKIEAGAGFRLLNQENKLKLWDSTVKIQQKSFSPSLNTSLTLSKTTQLTTNYMVDATAPNAEQLSPVRDNTNPLYIKIGNPSLKSQIQHNASVAMRYFDPNVQAYATVSGTMNFYGSQIIADTYYDSVGRQVSTFRNMNGAYKMSINVDGGTIIKVGKKPEHGLGPQLILEVSKERSIGFINRKENISNSIRFAPQVSMMIMMGAAYTTTLTGSTEFYHTSYSLAGIENINYAIYKFSLFNRSSPLKHLVISNSIDFYKNTQLSAGFQKSSFFWNASIAYSCTKNDRLTITGTVNDILNKNNNVMRTVSATGIETSQSNVLRRYALLSLSYKISRFNPSIMPQI